MAVGDGATWVANNASEVVRIGAGRHNISRVAVGNDPSGIAIGRGATWVADDYDGTVSRIDSTGAVTASTQVGPGASGIASGAGAVWVADTLADTLVRIDPTSDPAPTETPIRVGRGPRGVAVGAGAVWVANGGDGTVSRVDPRTHRVRTIQIGQSPQAVVVSGGAVWVTVDASPATPSPSAGARGVLRIAREFPFVSTDPALIGVGGADLQAPQLYYATCAGLLTYPDRPAPEGTRLMPDVAAAMPSRSDHGRTYTFIVRRGFRFSPPSNAPVTAATFRHTIERALGPKLKGSNTWTFMRDIVGMHAFRTGRAAHLAGVSVSGDRLTIRLIEPAPDLPARIATPAFCASPDDTPATPLPLAQAVPSAGPYYVALASPDQVVLKRNPNYAGHRPRIPTEIIYSSRVRLPDALNEVAAGRSDDVDAATAVISSASALARLNALEQRYGPASAAARTGHQRYFVNPWTDVEYFALNTTRHLFASARMRRAVNYAINRRALAQHPFFFNGGLATDHYLVPGIPGPRPVGIYPLGGANLAEARRLAGHIHSHATMYTCAIAPQCAEDARIVQTDLAKIGITVDITALPPDRLFARLAKPGEPWDIGWSNWFADFADPFTMINELFDPRFDPPSGFNFGRFDDPASVKRMRQAARLTGRRRLQAYRRLDQDLARNEAPVAAWGIGTVREFFSARVGCQVWQPLYGFDLGSFCLRR
jgi:ABC-type transport system substrate-binding protein